MTVRDILRGALTRFVPGALGLFAVVLGFDLGLGARFGPMFVPLFSAAIGGLIAGYALAMILLRARMREDAQVHGRRSVIVGVVAAAAWYGVAMLTGNPWHNWWLFLASYFGIGVAMGVVGALAVFFPWITAVSDPSSLAATAHSSPNEES